MDPCATVVTERPQYFFDYDAATGEIVPKSGLSGEARRKAQDTINDLGLNEIDVRFYRLDWTRSFVADLTELPVSERQALVEFHTSKGAEYAGVTMMVAEQLRHNDQLFP